MGRPIRWLVLPLLALSLTGCFPDPDIALMVDALRADLAPARLAPQAEFRLGEGSLGMARSVCSWVPDCQRDLSFLLDDLRQLHVGMYEIDGGAGHDPLVLTAVVREKLRKMGWEVALDARSAKGESQWVLARVVGGELRGLYLVVAEDREVVVLKLEGRLSRVLDLALRRDEGFYRGVRELAREI